MEVRPYNPQFKKLDKKIISGYFIGYYVGSRGSRFYYPSHTTRVIESDRAIYLEDDISKEHPIFIPLPITFALISSLVVD